MLQSWAFTRLHLLYHELHFGSRLNVNDGIPQGHKLVVVVQAKLEEGVGRGWMLPSEQDLVNVLPLVSYFNL